MGGMIKMKISDPYFSNVPGIGDLNFDYCIVEYEVPILFICKDKQGKYYLCDCCEIRSKQEWLIVPVVIEDVLALFEKKITLKNFFKDRESLGYFGTYKIGWTKEKIKKVESFGDYIIFADNSWTIVKKEDFDNDYDITEDIEELTDIHKDMEDFEFLGTKSTEITVQFKDK